MIDRTTPTRFSPDQRHQLSRLQVVPEQIEELESVLPQCLAIMRNPAARNDVRDELIQLAQALEKAAAAIYRIEGARENQPVLSDALDLITTASISMGRFDGESATSKALGPLEAAKECAARAIKMLPAEQSRQESPWGPVELIYHALLRGWQRAHGQTAARFPHRPSMGQTREPFRRVVGICYDALRGENGNDPERQLREFCKHFKEAGKR